MKKILLTLTLVFAVSSSAFAASSETESNNTFETANTLNVDSSILGEVDRTDKEDNFVFVANKTGQVRVLLTGPTGLAAVGLYNSDTEYIKNSAIDIPLDFDVVAGQKYYLKVVGFNQTTSYNLSVSNL
ncbi:hypothetical protein GPJ61_07625 [Brevibacillus formosus]|uniref:hypothetical protein n=1 Tax=Brevibacillus formosus TaxID=54913 RepID=UPI001CA490A8|nr:hypothetical protein [Brevibacillus formosus]MBW5467728.1 hypothetical protein [Brevibacillus formosus]